MTNVAPGQGSPVDNPNALPADLPYEPQQGTGEGKKSQKEVDEQQEREFIAPVDSAPRTDTDGQAIPDEPEPKHPKHAKKDGKKK